MMCRHLSYGVYMKGTDNFVEWVFKKPIPTVRPEYKAPFTCWAISLTHSVILYIKEGW